MLYERNSEIQKSITDFVHVYIFYPVYMKLSEGTYNEKASDTFKNMFYIQIDI